MGNPGQVHLFLHRSGGQHGKTGLPCSIDVAVVPEDTQGMACQGPGTHVKHRGQQLTGNLIHIGDHKQQPLRGRIGGGQGSRLQGAVDGSRRSPLTLHLRQPHRPPEHVFSSVGRPLVHIFGHRRRWRNGINAGHLTEHVTDMRSGIITITCDELFLFCHN